MQLFKPNESPNITQISQGDLHALEAVASKQKTVASMHCTYAYIHIIYINRKLSASTQNCVYERLYQNAIA